MDWDPIAKASEYASKMRASEVEMAVRSDQAAGRVPTGWYGTLKAMEWDAEKFLEILKEQTKGNENENREVNSTKCSECEEDGDGRCDECEKGLEL